MRVTQNFDATKTVIGQVEKMQTFLKEMNSKLIEEGGVSDSWDEGYVSSAGNHYDDDIDNYDDAAADEYVEILKQREKLDGVEDKVIEFPSVEIISKLEKELLLEMNYTARGASSSSSSSPLSPGGLYTGAAISSNTSSPQRELYTLTAYGSHDKIDDLVTDLTDKTLVVLTTNKRFLILSIVLSLFKPITYLQSYSVLSIYLRGCTARRATAGRQYLFRSTGRSWKAN